jgi:hypothetical protein
MNTSLYFDIIPKDITLIIYSILEDSKDFCNLTEIIKLDMREYLCLYKSRYPKAICVILLYMNTIAEDIKLLSYHRLYRDLLNYNIEDIDEMYLKELTSYIYDIPILRGHNPKDIILLLLHIVYLWKFKSNTKVKDRYSKYTYESDKKYLLNVRFFIKMKDGDVNVFRLS